MAATVQVAKICWRWHSEICTGTKSESLSRIEASFLIRCLSEITTLIETHRRSHGMDFAVPAELFEGGRISRRSSPRSRSPAMKK
jgi:hypothetical protein